MGGGAARPVEVVAPGGDEQVDGAEDVADVERGEGHHGVLREEVVTVGPAELRRGAEALAVRVNNKVGGAVAPPQALAGRGARAAWASGGGYRAGAEEAAVAVARLALAVEAAVVDGREAGEALLVQGPPAAAQEVRGERVDEALVPGAVGAAHAVEGAAPGQGGVAGVVRFGV